METGSKQEPMFSIITPVYNVENVLERCINSILNQTYEDFELILIDDGSTDKSGEICDAFSEKDKRIKVFHKPNGGVSSARNVGLDNAIGKYIVFVDSDDYVEETLLQVLNSDFLLDFDFVSFNYKVVQEDGKFKILSKYESFFSKNAKNDDIIGFLKKTGGICGKKYKLEIINNNNIRFDDDCSYGEDILFYSEYLSKATSVAQIENCLYYYCWYSSDSLSKAKNPRFRVMELQEKIYYFFSDKPVIQQFIISRYFWMLDSNLMLACNKQTSLKNKIMDIKRLIKSNFLVEHVNESYFNPILKLFMKLKLNYLIMLWYSRNRSNQNGSND